MATEASDWAKDNLKSQFLQTGAEYWSDEVLAVLREAKSSQQEFEDHLKPAREIKQLADEAANWKGVKESRSKWSSGWRYLGMTQMQFRNLVVRRDRHDGKTPAGNIYSHLRRVAITVRQLNCLLISPPDFVRQLYRDGKVPPPVSFVLALLNC